MYICGYGSSVCVLITSYDYNTANCFSRQGVEMHNSISVIYLHSAIKVKNWGTRNCMWFGAQTKLWGPKSGVTELEYSTM